MVGAASASHSTNMIAAITSQMIVRFITYTSLLASHVPVVDLATHRTPGHQHMASHKKEIPTLDISCLRNNQ